MPQKTYRQGDAPAPQKKKKTPRWPVFIILVLVLFLAALLLSRLATPPAPVAPSSVPVSSRPPVSSLPPPASSAPPPGPYDEKKLPMLLNAQNPLPENYEPALADVGYGNGRVQTMEARAAAAFNAMKEAAKAEGITLTPYSCYRSHQQQVNNYNSSVRRYIDQGYSKEKATELTRQYYAIPGTSEHEAGFAIDIDSIQESFEKTPAFAWLQKNCTKFGFILRYAKDTEPITGIAYEPWHYRYVGANHAKLITASGLTLEEYMEQNQIG